MNQGGPGGLCQGMTHCHCIVIMVDPAGVRLENTVKSASSVRVTFLGESQERNK